MESRMAKEPKDEVRPLTESCKTAIDPSTEIADTAGQRMAQVLLAVAMAALLGI
jgi:hypothetical protein